VNDWKVIPTIALTTVLIFGAGVFTGGFLVNSFKPAHNSNNTKKVQPVQHVENSAATNSATASPPKPSNARVPEILNKGFLQRLDDELHLTPEQHEAVQKIINDGQNEMRKVVQDSRLEIRDVLSPDQQKQFDDLVKRPFKRSLFTTNAPMVSTNTATNAP
jgi:Spy/CpxP family protein refolding chaperone